MDTTTQQKLESIFRAVLELPDSADVTQLDQLTAKGWDSLAHVTLMAAIEDEFGITVDVTDALRITSFPLATAVLEELGV